MHWTNRREKFRALLAGDRCFHPGSVFDAMSARIAGDVGFEVGMFAGSVGSLSVLGSPDDIVLTLTEFAGQAYRINRAGQLPLIGDGDTGYGNALNVRRTVEQYARAGFGAVMIEDQVTPKRCGHTKGKLVVDRDEAFNRIKAAVDAREAGADIMILARTDARHGHGLDEAIERAQRFHELGADILFIEAPRDQDEMQQICEALPGPKMANLIEGGLTPVLSPADLQEIGFSIAAYPITLMAAGMKAMTGALQELKTGKVNPDRLMPFDEVKTRIGFDAYFEAEKRYQDRK